jgi:hypothetical protein
VCLKEVPELILGRAKRYVSDVQLLTQLVFLDASDPIPSRDATLAEIQAGPSDNEIPNEIDHRLVLRAIKPCWTRRERQTR